MDWVVYTKTRIIVEGYIYNEKKPWTDELTWRKKVGLKYLWKKKDWNNRIDSVGQEHMLLTDLAKVIWINEKNEDEIKAKFAGLKLVTTTSISL